MKIISKLIVLYIVAYAIYYKLLKLLIDRIKKYQINKLPVDNSFLLDDLFGNLTIPPDSNIYLYVGLKKLRKITGMDYTKLTERITEILINNFKAKSILVPTNTFIFRKSRVFSIVYSPSEVGVFSELFRKIANFRTIDPIHNFSIWSKEISFYRDLDYQNTFSAKGLFGSTISDNYFALNIGTDEFKVHHIHYLEYQHKVPYLNFEKNLFNGVVFDSNNNPIEVEQENLASKHVWKINFFKQTNALRKANVLKEYSYKGIHVKYVTTADYCKVFNQKLKQNQYYFPTF